MNRRIFMKAVGATAAVLGISVTAKPEKPLTEDDLLGYIDLIEGSPKREMQGIFWVEGSDYADFPEPQPISKKYIELIATSINMNHAKFCVHRLPNYRYIRIASLVSGIECYLVDKSRRGMFVASNMLESNRDMLLVGATA